MMKSYILKYLNILPIALTVYSVDLIQAQTTLPLPSPTPLARALSICPRDDVTPEMNIGFTPFKVIRRTGIDEYGLYDTYIGRRRCGDFDYYSAYNHDTAIWNDSVPSSCRTRTEEVYCNQPDLVNRWGIFQNQTLSSFPVAKASSHILSPDAPSAYFSGSICASVYDNELVAGIVIKKENKNYCSPFQLDHYDYGRVLSVVDPYIDIPVPDGLQGMYNKPPEFILMSMPANNPPMHPACVTSETWIDAQSALDGQNFDDVADVLASGYPVAGEVSYCKIYDEIGNSGIFSLAIGIEYPDLNYRYEFNREVKEGFLAGGCVLNIDDSSRLYPASQSGMNGGYQRLNINTDSGWIKASEGMSMATPIGCIQTDSGVRTVVGCRYNNEDGHYLYGIAEQNGDTCFSSETNQTQEIGLLSYQARTRSNSDDIVEVYVGTDSTSIDPNNFPGNGSDNNPVYSFGNSSDNNPVYNFGNSSKIDQIGNLDSIPTGSALKTLSSYYTHTAFLLFIAAIINKI